jgi:hypothetical protein
MSYEPSDLSNAKRPHSHDVIRSDGSYELRESPGYYKGILDYENGSLRLQNTYFWDDMLNMSNT